MGTGQTTMKNLEEAGTLDSFTARFWPDGSCTVTLDSEVTHYTAEEVAEMERDYEQALGRLEQKGR